MIKIKKPETINFEIQDISQSMYFSIAMLICPTLFIIPHIVKSKNNSAMLKFYSNQSLIVLLSILAVFLLGNLIPYVGWFVILPFGLIAIAAMDVAMVYNAYLGKGLEFLFIGKYDLAQILLNHLKSKNNEKASN